MPRRPKLASGDGIVSLEWAGMTDNQLFERGVRLDTQRGDRGSLHNDEQSNSLLDCLGVSKTSQDRATLGAVFDELREFWIKCAIRNARRSARCERNAALSALIKRLRKFDGLLTNSKNDALSLFLDGNCNGRSPFSIFNEFPIELNRFATRLEAQIEDDTRRSAQIRRQHDCLFIIAAAAFDVAKNLQYLDSDSQSVVLRCLPWTNDYHAGSIVKVIELCRRLRAACEQAHAIGRKPGPLRTGEFDQLILWLAKLYQSCGNRVTHTPYKIGGEYDGAPQSGAGKFMIKFFAYCDTKVRPLDVSTALAKCVKRRHLV